MPTRNINLTGHLDAFIENTVSSGRYSNASEVVREGLRLLEQKAKEEKAKLAKLRQATAAGFDAIQAGDYRDVSRKNIGTHIAAIGRRAAARTRKSG
jgi:antitoxin ParD1/3/4